jgi:hypothetical protein
LPYLDPVVQDFVADATRFIAPMEAMIKAVENATDAVDKLNAAIALLSDKHVEISASVKGISGPIAGAIAQVEGLKAAMDGLGDATVKVNTDMGGTARAAGVQIGWFRLTGQALHWLVMGTLEIASTAVPALVALGAALGGMAPTAIHVSDVMNSLLVASGGLGNALRNSVGPLAAAGAGFGTLTKAMAPDVYLIMGSVISGLSGHIGTFATVAQGAGTVLARFASKLALELGPGGSLSQVTTLFGDGVKFMIQWGQVLGNLGHAFLNIVMDMWGVGKLLLDVLVGISKALEVLTANPVIGWLIGLVAAMSAAYRYAQLLGIIFRFLGGAAVVNGIKVLGGAMIEAAVAGGDLSGAIVILEIAMKGLWASIAPVATALGFIAAVVLPAWFVNSNQVSGATKKLISNVQSMPPTFANLNKGISQLSAALSVNEKQLGAVSKATGPATAGFKGLGAAGQRALKDLYSANIGALTKALAQQAVALVQLELGYGQMGARSGQVGAAMNAIAVQTAIADSKVQQMNQAIDAYISLLTGGTGGAAAFVESMQNIGSVAAHVRNNLGQATGTMSLSVTQFATALKSFSGNGAAAWNNFDQVVGSTMPQLLDWFRTAGVLGASTGADVSHAALDMAKSLVPLAARSRTAQATLMGVLRSAGLTVPSFAKLKQMVAQNGVGMGDLTKRVDGVTVAMSNLSQMAKNVANALSQQVSTQLANAALASSGFNIKLNKLQTDAADGAPWATIRGDLAQVQNSINTAGLRGIAWGNQMQQGSSHASSSVQGAGRNMVQSFAQAQSAAQRLQAFIDSMHGKNINISVTQSGGGGGGGAPIGGGGRINAGPGSSAIRVNVGAPGPAMVIHVHGSVLSEQQLGQVVQGGLNRKTIRNGSTQLFRPGRLH